MLSRDDIPTRRRDARGARPRRYRTVTADLGKLEAVLTRGGGSLVRAQVDPDQAPRVALDIDHRVDGVRANVQDAARAVLVWLAQVTGPEAGQEAGPDQGEVLGDVLARCLRPGPDSTRLNYAALAREIESATGCALTPKRVATAIRQLRMNHAGLSSSPTPAPQRDPWTDRRDALTQACVDRLESSAESAGDPRALSLHTLSVVRAAVSRVISHSYGEFLPESPDTAVLRARLERNRAVLDHADRDTDEQSMGRLLEALDRYDATAESDMRLIAAGARAVTTLMGSASLPAVMARLNLLVAGRDLIDHADYVQAMQQIADEAEALHTDDETQRLRRLARSLPEDHRLPSPRRIASYAHNNAATRILHRLFTGEMTGEVEAWLQLAQVHLNQLKTGDSGFELIPVTEAIVHTVAGVVSASRETAEARESFWQGLGLVKAVALVERMVKYESCTELVRRCHADARAALPELAEHLVAVR